MHDNEDTAKYRSNIANEICAGGASSLAEVVFVYIDSLKIFFEKVYREFGGYKKMCNLSLSLSLIVTRKIYKILFNFQWITNNIFPEKSSDSVCITSSFKNIKGTIHLWRYAAHGYIMSAYRFFTDIPRENRPGLN